MAEDKMWMRNFISTSFFLQVKNKTSKNLTVFVFAVRMECMIFQLFTVWGRFVLTTGQLPKLDWSLAYFMHCFHLHLELLDDHFGFQTKFIFRQWTPLADRFIVQTCCLSWSQHMHHMPWTFPFFWWRSPMIWLFRCQVTVALCDYCALIDTHLHLFLDYTVLHLRMLCRVFFWNINWILGFVAILQMRVEYSGFHVVLDSSL